MPEKDFADKLALVTGAGRGIGEAVALALAGAGARVVLTSRTGSELEATAARIGQNGGEASAVCCDLADEQSILALYAAVDEFGDLDILINNAGLGVFKPLTETTAAEWDRVQQVNLRGAFLCAREAMLRMQGRGGRIVNIASVVGLKGYANQAAYAASKHGLMGLTKVMALEGRAVGIVVQAVCPGAVATEMIRAARPDLDPAELIQPGEIAAHVLMLLRQRGNAITDCLSLRRAGGAPF